MLATMQPVLKARSQTMRRLSFRSAGLVCGVLFVFDADVLKDIGIGKKLRDEIDRDGLREDLGISDCDRHIKMSVIGAPEAFFDLHLFAMTMATRVQPTEVVEPLCVDNEGVPIPSPDRVTQPCGGRIVWKFAPVGKDLAKDGFDLIKEHHLAGNLNDLK